MKDSRQLIRKNGILFKNATVLTMDNHQVLYGCDVRIQRVSSLPENTASAILQDREERAVCDTGSKTAGTQNGPAAVITDVKPGLLPFDGDQVVDCTGKYLMPGLIDAHVHFDQDYMGVMLLAAGITSVRNMRGYTEHAERKRRIREGLLPGPYIESTGPIFDGEDPNIPENDNWIIRSFEDADEAIAFTMELGFRFVKTYPSIRPEVYRYLMRRCADEDLPVSGHMTKTISHQELMDLGYYCCEHASSLPKVDEDIDCISRAGLWFCPTQLVCETLPDYVWNGKRLQDLEKWDALPVCVQQEWLRKNEVIAESYRKQGIHPDIRIIINRGRRFMEHSSRILAGSDCAYPGVIPGFSLWTELEKLVNLYGMTSEEALLSATARPAACMKLGGRKGRIAEGMDADLILLSQNPLSDIRHISAIQTVVSDGKLYSLDFLERELKNIHQITHLPESAGGKERRTQ